jgi:hypothetical protein
MTWRPTIGQSQWALGAAMLIMLATLAPVRAQAPAQDPAPPPQALAPKPCADATIGRRGPSSPGSSPNEDLSQKLEEGNGVLCPPQVDPDIQAPTPNVGRTPIIPAPGTPGGNPSVQPK